MTKFGQGKSRFPTFAKAWELNNSPEVRALSRRLFYLAVPIFLGGAVLIFVSGTIYQNTHP